MLTERDELREWSEENDYAPVVADDEPDVVSRDEIRDHHEEVDWDTFHDRFESRNLALAYETGAGGNYRLVERDSVVDEHGEIDDSATEELLAGETVTTTVTETEVVETEVTEKATIESEIIGSELVETKIVDTEVVGEELVGVAVVEDVDASVVDHATDDDGRRYFDEEGTVEIEEEGAVLLEIDETRSQTEEHLEEKIVESRVVDDSVDQESQVVDESVDVDTDAINAHIEDSGVVGVDTDVVTERRIETEFDEDDRATSTITERRLIEKEIDERKTVVADIEDIDVFESEVVSERELGEAAQEEFRVPDTDLTDGDDEFTDDHVDTTVGRSESDHISNRVMGWDVELPDGEAVGIISEVDEDADRLYIDKDPGFTDKLKASLNWGDEEDTATLRPDQIREFGRGTIVVEDSRSV